MNKAIPLATLVAIWGGHALAQDPGHFHQAGPLAGLVAKGTRIAPVAAGLAFDIPLSDKGSVPSSLHFELRPAGAPGVLRLDLEGLAFAGGRLRGTARLSNASGAVLEGLRLDATGATEEYRAKDEQGREALKTRAQSVGLASPLFFADQARGDASAAMPFEAGTLVLSPETTRITVHGVVSGLRFLGTFDVKGLENPAALDVAPDGRLHLADLAGSRLVRTDAEGRNAQDLAKLPDQPSGLAVDPLSGELVACWTNSPTVHRFSKAGAPMGEFQPGGATTFLRFDRKGTLFGFGSHVLRFSGAKTTFDLGQVGQDDLYAKGLDIGDDGALWFTSGLEHDRHVFRYDPAAKKGRRVASGPDWHLGGVDTPQAVRVDAAGLVYVAELGEEGVEAARISVFDRSGAFVRAFGRGGKAPVVDAVLPGQVWRPADMAFGRDGRVYVACENDGGFSRHLMLMFQPF